ncbi:MAG TPA: hypothetical protein VGF14_04810 [Alphaproteobacteria bacterium]
MTRKTTILTDKVQLHRLFDAPMAPVCAFPADSSAACQIRRYYASLRKNAALSQNVLNSILNDYTRHSA